MGASNNDQSTFSLVPETVAMHRIQRAIVAVAYGLLLTEFEFLHTHKP
jgi:hypothetical protein